MDNLWSAPVSGGSDPQATEAAAVVPEPRLSSGMVPNEVCEVGIRKSSSSSDTIVPDGDSWSCSAESVHRPVSHISTSQPPTKPPNHTAVHGLSVEFVVQC